MNCSIQDCEVPAKTRGYCNRHYLKWWKHGNPEAGKTLAKRGTGGKHSGGYRTRSVNGKQRLEHILVAERVLGRALPPGSRVHHVNHDRADNRTSNLVICPDEAYHQLLHRRERAFDACGHADWLKCQFCKQWGPPDTMRVFERKSYHTPCRRTHRVTARNNL